MNDPTRDDDERAAPDEGVLVPVEECERCGEVDEECECGERCDLAVSVDFVLTIDAGPDYDIEGDPDLLIRNAISEAAFDGIDRCQFEAKNWPVKEETP